jgi:hypothetical protein
MLLDASQFKIKDRYATYSVCRICVCVVWCAEHYGQLRDSMKIPIGVRPSGQDRAIGSHPCGCGTVLRLIDNRFAKMETPCGPRSIGISEAIT